MFGYQNFTLSAPHLSGLMQYSIISLSYCSFITRVNTADVTAVLNIIPLKKKKKKSNYIGFLILAVKNWPNTFEVGWNDFWHLILQNQPHSSFLPLSRRRLMGFCHHPIRSDQLCSYKDVTADTNILMLFCCLLSLSHLSERAVQEMRRQGLSFSTLQTSSSLSVSSSSHHISPERSILRSLDHSTDKSADK